MSEAREGLQKNDEYIWNGNEGSMHDDIFLEWDARRNLVGEHIVEHVGCSLHSGTSGPSLCLMVFCTDIFLICVRHFHVKKQRNFARSLSIFLA